MTAYEMRISDWSSDVCSSDLPRDRCARAFRRRMGKCDARAEIKAIDHDPEHQDQEDGRDERKLYGRDTSLCERPVSLCAAGRHGLKMLVKAFPRLASNPGPTAMMAAPTIAARTAYSTAVLPRSSRFKMAIVLRKLFIVWSFSFSKPGLFHRPAPGRRGENSAQIGRAHV